MIKSFGDPLNPGQFIIENETGDRLVLNRNLTGYDVAIAIAEWLTSRDTLRAEAVEATLKPLRKSVAPKGSE